MILQWEILLQILLKNVIAFKFFVFFHYIKIIGKVR